jgi:hypothetical protein
VEATERLGVSARLFLEELYRASGRLWELDNLIGPSPIQSLLSDIVTVVAKFNAQAMLFHKRNVSPPPATTLDKPALAMCAVEKI